MLLLWVDCFYPLLFLIRLFFLDHMLLCYLFIFYQKCVSQILFKLCFCCPWVKPNLMLVKVMIFLPPLQVNLWDRKTGRKKKYLTCGPNCKCVQILKMWRDTFLPIVHGKFLILPLTEFVSKILSSPLKLRFVTLHIIIMQY